MDKPKRYRKSPLIINIACLIAWAIAFIAVIPLIKMVRFDKNNGTCQINWDSQQNGMTNIQYDSYDITHFKVVVK